MQNLAMKFAVAAAVLASATAPGLAADTGHVFSDRVADWSPPNERHLSQQDMTMSPHGGRAARGSSAYAISLGSIGMPAPIVPPVVAHRNGPPKSEVVRALNAIRMER